MTRKPQPPLDPLDLLTTAEVSRIWNVPADRISWLVQARVLAHVRLGGQLCIPRSAAKQCLEG